MDFTTSDHEPGSFRRQNVVGPAFGKVELEIPADMWL